MFMGDQAPFDRLNFRQGVFGIFSGSAPQNNQRAHIFAVGRRKATRLEKLLAVPPVSAGGITVSSDNGNTIANPRVLGSTTDPAVMGWEGFITTEQLTEARA